MSKEGMNQPFRGKLGLQSDNELNKLSGQALPRELSPVNKSTPACQILWNFIATELEVRGLSLAALSRETGVARKTFERYKAGKTQFISERILEKLCKQFEWEDSEYVRLHIAMVKDAEMEGELITSETDMLLFHPRYHSIIGLKKTDNK